MEWSAAEKLDLEGLSDRIGELFPEFTIDFSSFIGRILEGDIKGAASGLFSSVRQGLLAEVSGMKNLFLALLLIGMISALCAVLMQTFKNHQIADVAHFIAYLLMLAVIFGVYKQAAQITRELLSGILLFVRLFVPTFMLALGLSAGSATAVGYYQVILLVLYVLEQALMSIAVPAVNVYLMFTVMNGIWEEERLEGLMELIQKGVSGGLKLFLSGIAGIGLLQSMVTPVLEQLKWGAASKTLSAIPGLGGLAEGTAQLLLGSAVLIKNGLGVAAILLLLLLCAVPLGKLLFYGTILKLCAGLMGLAADSRLTGCVGGAGNAVLLLMRIACTAGACFMIMFAIITCLAGTMR